MTLVASEAVLGTEQGLHNHGRKGRGVGWVDGPTVACTDGDLGGWVDSMLPRTWEE